MPAAKFLQRSFILKIPTHQVAIMPYYLETTSNIDDAGLNEIKTWLQGYITRADFFTNPPPKLADLRAGLKCAVQEILLRLDPELEAEIHRAGEPQYSIETDQDDFFEARQYIFEDIQGNRPAYLNRKDAQDWLEIARDEIAWMTNETRRLAVHIKNAAEQKRLRIRNSFVYYPTKRKEPCFSKVPFVQSDEEEDAEMLEPEEAAGDANQEAEAHKDSARTSLTPEQEHDGKMLDPSRVASKVLKEMQMSKERALRSVTPERKIKDEDYDMEDGEIKEEADAQDEDLDKRDSPCAEPESKSSNQVEAAPQPGGGGR